MYSGFPLTGVWRGMSLPARADVSPRCGNEKVGTTQTDGYCPFAPARELNALTGCSVRQYAGKGSSQLAIGVSIAHLDVESSALSRRD